MQYRDEDDAYDQREQEKLDSSTTKETHMKRDWTIAVSADTNPQQYVAFRADAKLTHDQAQYVAHAANAYPKMVEALRRIHQQRVGLTQEANPLAASFCDQAGALLRSLGEVGK